MRVGDRVVIVSAGSLFRGERGHLVQVLPTLLVQLDGEDGPLVFFGTAEVMPDESKTQLIETN